MCGVFGIISNEPSIDVIYEGLLRLEYRGYDSAGIAVNHAGKIECVKTPGKLIKLKKRIKELPQSASLGIGHTRWATHGIPNEVNAHPHVWENCAIIHNGIIENYVELRNELTDLGYSFQSETDTEVILKLLHSIYNQSADAIGAITETAKKLQGAYAVGVMFTDKPDCLYVMKQGSPMVVAYNEGESFFSSDAMAFGGRAEKAMFLEDGEIIELKKGSIKCFDMQGAEVPERMIAVDQSTQNVGKQGYKHYMLKEIHEQPTAMSNQMSHLLDMREQTFNEINLGLEKLDCERINNITMVACGTAYLSMMPAKYLIEEICQIPVNLELGSEYRNRKSFANQNTLFISVSQSGETADTLASMKVAKENGCQTLSICNVKMSSISREATAVLQMKAGPEIGVASTKAYTTMLLSHYIFAYGLANKRGLISQEKLAQVFQQLKRLPALFEQATALSSEIENLVSDYYEFPNFLYVGRGMQFATALEGALKLKEISYIHAEGYAGGELKHGPIALVDRHMPIVAIAPRDANYEKMLANIEEIKAREGIILSIGSNGDQKLKELSKDVLLVPELEDDYLQCLLTVVPLQFLAYFIAVKRGTDVDQPRNLAKSVTVE